MQAETEIFESLKAVGYEGKLEHENVLVEAIAEGPKSENFRDLIRWLTWEIHFLRNTDEKLGSETDFNEFMLELSAFLKEIACPYEEFVAGPLTSRLQTKESRILLCDYLLTELMASKMYQAVTPEDSSYEIPVFETQTAKALKCITKELNLGKPPENISPKALFDKIAVKLDEILKQTNPNKLSKPLFVTSQNLTDAQWEKLDKLHKQFDEEYNLRREMLLTRLEVTIQSFQWSDKTKTLGNEIMEKYRIKREELEPFTKGGTDTDIAALLAARADLAIIEKTSNANVRANTSSKIQKHVIGKVPDRGGRAYEHAPPPPEMPSWQQNRSTGPSGGAGSSGGRGGGNMNRGGGKQGNWNQQNQGNFGAQGQYDQRQQFNQRQPSFDQRQQYGQGGQGQQQYNQRQDNQWQGGGQGGGRVQGGWSQRGGERGDGHFNKGGGNYFAPNQIGQNFQNQGYGATGGGNNYANDRVNSQRGRQNYHRGGGSGGGRR